MTIDLIREVCRRELLFDSDFLIDYKKELNELITDPSFMDMIDRLSSSVPEELEFSRDPYNSDFRYFKKERINNIFFKERAKYRFPAYCSIVESVIAKGKSGLSATISVYYAIRYLSVGEKPLQTTASAGKIQQSKMHVGYQQSDSDYRKKWPANWRCEDGHYVRSKNEQLLDNWLYHHNICHAYEPLIVDKRTGMEYISDFYLPCLKQYIEVWGFETEEYRQRKAGKLEAYRANGLSLLEMSDHEVQIMDDFLQRNILVKL